MIQLQLFPKLMEAETDTLCASHVLPGDNKTGFKQICFNPENLQEHFTIYGIL